MPELPEVEAVCRRLQHEAKGAQVVSARLLRKRDRKLENKVPGHTIQNIERSGKNILLHLDGGLTVRVHLRMTGNLYVIPDLRFRPAATRAYFEFRDGRSLILDDRRALGVVELVDKAAMEKLRRQAGIEPLSENFTTQAFVELASRSKAPAKLFLMNQARVGGLGNIYSAEALYRARVHPAKPVNRLSRPKLETLRQAIIAVLNDAMQSAIHAYSGPGRFEAEEAFPLAVYDREGQPCAVCGKLIRRIAQGGRSTYFCPGCQRK